MGAGNVKAATPVRRIPEPTPLRLEPLHINKTSSPHGGNGARDKLEDHISPLSPLLSAASSPGGGRKWDVTCDVHRSLICRFCGGKSCKREDWRKQADTPAIAGLHSTWVSANVLGMQRPSSRLLREYGIIDAMKKAGVGAIFNLQLAGEHKLCGDGIDERGFSYRAEEFTDHGIYYYNPGSAQHRPTLMLRHCATFIGGAVNGAIFPSASRHDADCSMRTVLLCHCVVLRRWVDMNIPSLERMLEIVQMMSFHTDRSQKVAVHCHAGSETTTNETVAGYFMVLLFRLRFLLTQCACACVYACAVQLRSHGHRNRVFLRVRVRFGCGASDQKRA